MAPSASDIITYGGVPLAVIGVLPTLYIFFRALMTLRDIRRTFARNHVVAITRPSTLAGLVEVELPRLSLAPLDRNDPLYFCVNRARSDLKGGSWTAVYWREMRVGTACYRVQYHDQLRQPAADVDFESLIAFMLDRGAVPDACGWADLREAGMWTPTGTVLLRSPAGRGGRGGEPVLRTTTSEDSDGLLALILQWRPDWDCRTVDDLPPYWMRIKAPLRSKAIGISNGIQASTGAEKDSEHVEDSSTVLESQSDEKTLINTESSSFSRYSKLFLTAEVKEHDYGRRQSISSFRSHGSYHTRHGHGEHLTSLPDATPSLRLRLSPSGLSTLLTEPVQAPLYAPHIHPPHTLSPFFSAACSALAHLPTADEAGGLLWSHSPPPAILALAHTPSIPLGILALLDILPGCDAWRSPDHLAKLAIAKEMADLAERQRRETQMRAMMSESRLSPKDGQRAAIERMQREMTERRYEQERLRLDRSRAEELEVQEAVSSRRVAVAVVAEACREWLVRQELVDADEPVSEIVERLLWECVRQEKVAHAMGSMLDDWRTWLEAGGVTREGFEALKGRKVEFAYSACLLALVGATSASESGSVGSDIQECLRLWKKDRLG